MWRVPFFRIFMKLSNLFILLLLVSCAAVPYDLPPQDEHILQVNQSQTNVIKASGPWRSSGIRVLKGNRYIITAEGRWQQGGLASLHPWCGPDGIGEGYLASIIKDYSESTLIAKIDDKSLFSVGSSKVIEPKYDGLLYFRVNGRPKISIPVKKLVAKFV